MTSNGFAERRNGAGRARTKATWSKPWIRLAALMCMRGLRADRPRRIDHFIDYFGEPRRAGQTG
jgi:hypothetical protein